MDIAIPEFISEHSRALVISAAIVVVIIVICVMYWYGWFSESFTRGKKSDRVLDSVDEFDRLIDSIHAKQGIKKGPK